MKTKSINKMRITKIFNFDSAHRLDWDDGKCKQLHGHTYKLFVTIEGKLNENGIVINFHELKRIVTLNIIDVLDHQYLNDIIDNPTAENLVVWIWDKLITKINLHEIVLYETPTSYVSFRGM